MEKVKKFYHDETGNATEYALIVTLVSIAIMAGATVLGDSLSHLFAQIVSVLPSPWN